MKHFLFVILLPVTVFGQRLTTVSGTIADAARYLRQADRVEIRMRDQAFGEDVNYFGKIGKDGKFSITFPKAFAEDIELLYKDAILGLFVRPGDRLHISFQANGNFKHVAFSGDGAALNREYNTYLAAMKANQNAVYGSGGQRFAVFRHKQDAADENDFKSFLKNRYRSDSTFAERYIKLHLLSREIAGWITADLQYTYVNDLIAYPRFHKRPTAAGRYKPSADYYRFLDGVQLADSSAVVSSAYIDFLRRYYGYLTRENPVKFSTSIGETFQLLRERPGATIAEKERLHRIAKNSGYDTDADSVFMDSLVRSNYSLLNVAARKKTDEPFASLPGIARDLVWAHEVYASLDRQDFIMSKYLVDRYAAVIANKAIRDQMVNCYEVAEARRGASVMPPGAVFATTPRIATADFFEKLVAKYRGKVIYNDFWATWCGPCRADMPYSAALKKRLSGKDVVFLYICVESDKKTWEKVIAQLGIEGEHYLLTANEYSRVSERFRITAVPHYVLIDKSGRVANSNALAPSEKDVKLGIEELL